MIALYKRLYYEKSELEQKLIEFMKPKVLAPTSFSWDVMASEIIKIYEQNGMLPPKTWNPRYNSDEASKYLGHPFIEYSEEPYVNEWQKE